MKIAVLSDIHDHLTNLEKFLVVINGKVEAVVFCGDLISPFITGVLAKSNLPTYLCLGNNDEDHIGMLKKGGEKFIWTHLSQEYGQVELDGRKMAFCHYPKLAQLLANSGEYDAVFFGHTHNAGLGNHGKTLLLNPGSVCGINFEKGQYDTATFAIYDTASNNAEIIAL